ncbi:hypothetical protein [Pediococcus acidilactici]|uniref:hypothetical protein n=1 Tax=Pediococcus acidilactici TaxID=1254 RepID=UPI001F4EC3E7|nr:hypothetical protein [Pediococcus acidilactici]MCH9265922.1 hypothetical protein [Pediococcus acidilactici]MCK2074122.1 hypothetical protein [Pediococcus acidilactici]
MKKMAKLFILSSTILAFTGSVGPSITVLADNTNTEATNIPISSSEYNQKNYQKLYNSLSPEKKKEFDEITKDQNLSPTQQYNILQERNNLTQDRTTLKQERTPQWKLTLLKKAVKYGAKLIGKKLKNKTLASIVNYLTGFENNIQKGLEKAFIKYLHVSKSTAKWVAKTLVFIFF